MHGTITFCLASARAGVPLVLRICIYFGINFSSFTLTVAPDKYILTLIKQFVENILNFSLIYCYNKSNLYTRIPTIYYIKDTSISSYKPIASRLCHRILGS